MTTRAVSKHVGVLEAAGLVTRGSDAQRRPSRIRAEPLVDVDGWLQSYRRLWESRFQRYGAPPRYQVSSTYQPQLSPWFCSFSQACNGAK
jgi:hypothetical protein